MSEQINVMTELRWEDEKVVSMFETHPPIDIASSKKVADIPEAWSPLHLLVAAVESCFLLTALPLAEKMKISLKSYASTAEGTFEAKDGKHLELTSLTIRPTFHLEKDEDRPKLTTLVRKAEEYCYVARSIKIPVIIEV